MENTLIVSYNEFKDNVLPQPQVPHPTIKHTRVTALRKNLEEFFEKANWRPKEDDLAEHIVGLINRRHLCGPGYSTKLSRYSYSKNDLSKAKVDAAIYLQNAAPQDGRPDWTHCRMWIEFKRSGTSFDPFDDDNKNDPGASARTRTEVRGQLRAYAYNAMIYGHRTAIYGLLINGPEFRGMRYDRSGLIVTNKMNYVAQPFDFMEYLARFGSLDPVAQGLDPTATLLMEGSPEYMLMDKYGEELETDMDYLEGTVIPAYTPPVPAPPPPAPPSTSPSLAVSEAQPTGASGPTRMTRQQTRLASAFAGDPTPAAPHQEPAPAPAHQGSNVSAVEAVDDSANPRVFKYVREQFRKSLEDGWPRYRLEVGADKRTFLVGKPIFCSMSVLGRGTRAYVALDEKSQRFVFLKDSWRPFYLDVREEGYYLKELAGGEGWQYVPRVLCEGDVPGQVAFTARYHQEKYPPPTQTTTEDKQTDTLSSSHQESSTQPSTQSSTTGRKRSRPDTGNMAGDEVTSSFRKYTHYRIVLEDVCLPFISFTSVRQLVRLMLDCITAHRIAYENHNLLHRDVSAGNILILPRLEDAPEGGKVVRWHGILTDWELAKRVPKDGSLQNARQPERTGTWHFMSVHYVNQHPNAPVTVADELESFFHVLLFYAIRRLLHNIPYPVKFVVDYFDDFSWDARDRFKKVCGGLKSSTMFNGNLVAPGTTIMFHTEGNKRHRRFEKLIEVLLSHFAARYRVIRWRESKAKEKAKQASSSSRSQDPTPAADTSNAPPMPWKLKRKLASDEPSQDDFEAEERLKTHATTEDLYKWILDGMVAADLPPWSTTVDVVPDRLPDHYDPRPVIFVLNKMASTTGADEFAVVPGSATASVTATKHHRSHITQFVPPSVLINDQRPAKRVKRDNNKPNAPQAGPSRSRHATDSRIYRPARRGRRNGRHPS